MTSEQVQDVLRDFGSKIGVREGMPEEDLLKLVLEYVSNNAIDLATIAVLTLTLLVVGIYTVITGEILEHSKKQTDEIINQNRVTIAPSIFIDIFDKEKRSTSFKNQLYITNIGNGVAINIAVEKINIYKSHFGKINSFFLSHLPVIATKVSSLLSILKRYRVEFDKIGSIKPNEKITLNYSVYEKGAKTIGNYDILKALDEDHIKKKMDIVVIYQDIAGNRYRQVNNFVSGKYNHGFVGPWKKEKSVFHFFIYRIIPFAILLIILI